MSGDEQRIKDGVQEILAQASFDIIQKFGRVTYPYDHWEDFIKKRHRMLYIFLWGTGVALMAKVLTDKEVAGIVFNAVCNPRTFDNDTDRLHFLEGLGDLVADNFGGTRSTVRSDMGDGLGWTICFNVNDDVPADGGVYKDCDPDVMWKDGEEEQV